MKTAFWASDFMQRQTPVQRRFGVGLFDVAYVCLRNLDHHLDLLPRRSSHIPPHESRFMVAMVL